MEQDVIDRRLFPQLELSVARLLDKRLEAVQRTPQVASAWGNLGLALEANRLWAEAGRAYRRATELDSKDLTWQYRRAVVEYRQGDYAAAERRLRGLAEEFAQLPVAVRHRLGVLLTEAGQLQEAEEVLRQAVEQLPDRAELLTSLADVLAQQGENEQAARLLQRALQSDPQYGPAHYLLGSLLIRSDQQRMKQLANRHLALGRRAEIRFLPGPGDAKLAALAVNARSQTKQGIRLLAAKDPHAAIAPLTAAVVQQPDNLAALNSLAVAYAQTGKVDVAAELLAEALTVNERHPTTLINMASLELVRGDLDAAREFADRAVEAAPDRVESYLAKIRTLLAAKQPELARRAIQQARQIAADDPRIDQLEKAAQR